MGINCKIVITFAHSNGLSMKRKRNRFTQQHISLHKEGEKVEFTNYLLIVEEKNGVQYPYLIDMHDFEYWNPDFPFYPINKN
jgi:hypothetical protein